MTPEQETWLIEHIIEHWHEWDGEAMQCAQVEQSDDAYTDTMRDHLRRPIERAKQE